MGGLPYLAEAHTGHITPIRPAVDAHLPGRGRWAGGWVGGWMGGWLTYLAKAHTGHITTIRPAADAHLPGRGEAFCYEELDGVFLVSHFDGAEALFWERWVGGWVGGWVEEKN